jgi:YD repeat-containing protein
MADGQGTAGAETYTLDGVGRRLAVTRDGSVITYTYDAVGRVVTRTHPTGSHGKPFVEATEYDNDGRISVVRLNGTPVATSAYDPAGNLLTRTFANGVVEQHSYDQAGRVTRIAHTQGAAPRRGRP